MSVTFYRFSCDKTQAVQYHREDETAREGTAHPLSYAEAKKILIILLSPYGFRLLWMGNLRLLLLSDEVGNTTLGCRGNEVVQCLNVTITRTNSIHDVQLCES